MARLHFASAKRIRLATQRKWQWSVTCFAGVILLGSEALAAPPREIPAPPGGYAQVPVVRPDGTVRRPRPGEPLRVPFHLLAERGQFDPTAPVALGILPTERGYEAAYLGITPVDPNKGARLVVYSLPAEKVVTLVEDVNRLREKETSADAQPVNLRLIAPSFVQMGRRVYFASGPATLADRRPGPSAPQPAAQWHILAFDVPSKVARLVGPLPSVWEVRRLAAEGNDYLLVLLRRPAPERPDEEETRLIRFSVANGQAEDTGIMGVHELWPGREGAWHLAGPGPTVRQWRPGQPPEPVAIASVEGVNIAAAARLHWLGGAGILAGTSYLLRAQPTSQSFTFRLEETNAELGVVLRATAPSCAVWLRNTSWAGPRYPGNPFAQGVIYLARRGREERPGTFLTVCALSEGRLREYGPVMDRQTGTILEHPVALAINSHNDLIIVGIAGGRLVLAPIEDVFADEVLALEDTRLQTTCVAELPNALQVKAWSLTAVGDHLDRPYDALAVASDGTVYCGTMPHHPTRGTLIFRYDPRRDVLENLGDIDEIAGEKEPRDVPSMMHSTPVEVGGYMFFTGQDPFYGAASRFPELPKEAAYPGSHVLGFHLAKGCFYDFGIPAPGASVFRMAADPQRNHLYLRFGYERGPVHRLNVTNGEFEDLGLVCPTNTFFVGSDSNLYFTRRRDLVGYDPVSRVERAVYSGLWRFHWLKGQDGRAEAYGLSGTEVFFFDIEARQARRVGSIRPRSNLGGDAAYRNGVLYQVVSEMVDGRRVARLYTLTVADGRLQPHGLICDQNGRIAAEINAIDVGADGTLYMVGQFWPKPGDAYAPRLRPPYRDLGDDCFMVLKGLRP